MFTLEGPHIVMSRTDAQNGLDFHFKFRRVHTSNKQIRYETIEGKLTCYFKSVMHNASFDIGKKITRRQGRPEGGKRAICPGPPFKEPQNLQKAAQKV